MDEAENKSIMVSVNMMVYNHAKYLRNAIEGVLMQKRDFDIELLIHDDASTDGSQEIIREYQNNYPNIIKPIYQKENQFSKKIEIGLIYQYPRCKGKYIAMCEGDDYWTDPNKLKKQVSYLEIHPDFIACSHNVSFID